MKQHQPYILVGGLRNCAIARNMRQAQNLNHWWRFALPMPHCNWSFVVSSCSMENPHRSRWKSSTCMTAECQDWDAYCETVRLKLFVFRLSWGIPSIPSLWCPKPWPPNCTLSAKLHSFCRRRSCQSEALVAIDTLAHGVLSDLLSATGNNMDITWPVFWIMGRSRPCKTSIRSWATIPTSPCHLEDHLRSPRNVGCLSNKLRLEPHYGWMSVRYLKDYLGSQPLPTQLLDCTNHVAHLTHLTENWIQLHVIKLQHTY